MRSCNTYQDIKTPEDEEEELSINAIYQDLIENSLDESDGRPISFYTKQILMKKAKEIYYKKGDLHDSAAVM